jgi:hypothetical protein
MLIAAKVDDLTIITSTMVLMTQIKGELSKVFKIYNLGEIH